MPILGAMKRVGVDFRLDVFVLIFVQLLIAVRLWISIQWVLSLPGAMAVGNLIKLVFNLTVLSAVSLH